jgi:AbrB family looped-hinge helix DNA binding protein
MVEITAKISSKNQITVPAEVRRRLGVGASDTIAFFFTEGGAVEVQKPRFGLESILGSIPPLPGASPDFELEIEEATAEEIERRARRRS